jgi:hypothetical protein
MTPTDMDMMCQYLVGEHSHTWTSSLKAMSITEIKKSVINTLLDWKLAEFTPEGELKLYDVIGRFFEKTKEEKSNGA